MYASCYEPTPAESIHSSYSYPTYTALRFFATEHPAVYGDTNFTINDQIKF
jgi:hypothetical protein